DVTAHLASRGAAADHPGTGSAVAPTPRAPAERIEPTPPVPAGGQAVQLSAVRKRVADNMLKSWTSVPHVLQVVEADFHRVEQARIEHGAQWKKREGFSLTYLAFVVRAV